MAGSILDLHSGGQLVEVDQLDTMPLPSATHSWHPIKHSVVLDTVLSTLDAAGFRVVKQQLALAKEGARFFGTLDLDSPLGEGITLAVAIRNSHDKSFPIGLAMGSRTFCCSNLALSGEHKLSKKHTRFSAQRFNNGLAEAVSGLREFAKMETAKIEVLRNRELSDIQADSYILRSFEQGIISTPVLPKIIHEYREPSYPEFTPRTAFSLLSAYTTVMADRAVSNPAAYASMTMRLQQFLLQ